MQAHREGNLELRSYTIYAGDKYRVHVLGLVDREEAAEPADFAEHAAGKGLVRQILDALLGTVGAVDIHAGVGIGSGCASGCGILGHRYFFLSVSVWGNSGFLANQQLLRPLIVTRSQGGALPEDGG